MKLKSFFAETVEAGLGRARHELGPEAMFVTSRRTGAEQRHLGEYEVVCALVDEPVPLAQAAAGASESLSKGGVDRLSREVTELREQMERLASTLTRSNTSLSAVSSSPELAAVFNRLLDAEVDAEIAGDLVLKASGHANPTAAIRTELGRLFKVNASLEASDAGPTVVALIGPPGVGKTTTLTKLAIRFGLAQKRSVQILTADTYRIAAAEQLRSYAAILGLGFRVTDTPAAIAAALEEFRNRKLILIDTPGLCGADLDGFQDLAQFFSTHPSISVYLTLSASMRSADLRRVMNGFEMFRADRLIFTKLDETAVYGPMLNASLRSGKPIAFLSDGQRVPEDLESATKTLVLDKILEAGSPPKPLGVTVAA